MKRLSKILALVFAAALLSACAESEDEFGNVGDNIASPSTMTVDETSNRLYVVNSNSQVLYDSTQGSFQAYDISNPLAPALLKTTQTMSFSGEVYFDANSKRAYVPNRYSSVNSSATDASATMYNFNVDASAADYLSFTETPVAAEAYAIDCCYPVKNDETGVLPRAWITTGQQELQYVDIGGSLAPVDASLVTSLDNGGEITHAESYHIAIMGNQAFLSRMYGGIMIVNLDTANSGGAAPMDYFINDVETPRGMAVDATNNLLYVAGEGNNADDDWTQYLLIIDATKFPPKTDNTITSSVSKNLGNALLAMITVGNYPQEVLLTTAYAFVTNQNDDTVSVVDLAGRTNIKTITVGEEPFSLALYRTDADGDGTLDTDKYVYVGNIESNTFSIIDIATLEVAATYP